MFKLFEKKYKYTTMMIIEKMMCGHCESHIANELRKIRGVEKVKVSHTKKTAIIYSDVELDFELLKKTVDETGYEVISIK